MTDKEPAKSASKPAQQPSRKSARADRLAEVLRANLKRRKDAARARRDAEEGTPSEQRDDPLSEPEAGPPSDEP